MLDATERIILIGHGSPRKEANNIEIVGRLLHNSIHSDCRKDCVKIAYLQFAEPKLMTVIKEHIKDGAGKIIVHPFFLSSGMHVTKDIPDMIEEARNLYPDVEFVYSEPLGFHNKLVQVVLERIYNANGLKPEQIEKRSFDIISEEEDFSGIPSAQLPIIKRVIHATADYEFKNSLVFHPDAVNTGLKAIKSGKDILTDVEMVRTGINKKLLEQWGGNVICSIQNTGDAINTGNKTRAEAGIETALAANNNIGIVAIGNAPTALIKTIDLLLRSNNHEILVIGVPVGFVNALESKTLLSTQKFPFITNLSRKGGSPAAAAIVNALLKMAGEG